MALRELTEDALLFARAEANTYQRGWRREVDEVHGWKEDSLRR